MCVYGHMSLRNDQYKTLRYEIDALNVCVYVYMYVCACVCVCVCMYVYYYTRGLLKVILHHMTRPGSILEGFRYTYVK